MNVVLLGNKEELGRKFDLSEISDSLTALV